MSKVRLISLLSAGLLAVATQARAESSFRCTGCKPVNKGLQVSLAHVAQGGQQEVKLLMFKQLPIHDQIRAAAGGKPCGAVGSEIESISLATRKWDGTKVDKVVVPFATLKKLGVKGGDTVYISGYWPKWNHVWGYSHGGREVELKLPAFKAPKAQQNSTLGRRVWRSPTRNRQGASQATFQRRRSEMSLR